MARLPLRCFGAALLCCGLTPAIVGAQGIPGFGGGGNGQQASAMLTLTALEAADFNGSTGQAEDVRDPQYRSIQPYTILHAGVTLNPQKQEKFRWQLSAGTGVHYYQSMQEWFPTGNVLNASMSFALDGRTTVSATELATYSSSYSLVPFFAGSPTDGQSLASVDYSSVYSPNYTSATTVSITRALTSRASLSASYGFSRTSFTESNQPELNSTNAQVRFNYRFSRYAGFHAAYGRRRGYYFDSSVQESNIEDYDVGLDYNRTVALRASRNTVVNFSFGSSVTTDIEGRHIYGTGSATLTHRLGRNSQIGADYTRSVRLVEGLLAPVFSDAIIGRAGATLSRRSRLWASFGYVMGSVGRGDVGNTYGAWTGTGQFMLDLTHRLSLMSGYTFYQHSVGDAVVDLLGHLPTLQRRQTLFAGLSYGLPLTHEERTRR